MRSLRAGSVGRWFACAGLLACVAVTTLLRPSHAAEAAKKGPSAETKVQRDARMKWWREARFGMFIHWGLYSVPAGSWRGKETESYGEWIMSNEMIPVADYEKLAAQFNPTEFNADQWVLAAKSAGMKYIIFTAKHHEGFAMFHSRTSPFNIYDATPFKRDPLKELAEACKRHGMRLGFYYSQAQDWHHPGGAAYGPHWDPAAQDGSIADYVREIAVPQVREILTGYGRISVLWWDTPVGMTPELTAELASLTKLQPGIITNDRLGNGFPGDVVTPEQSIPANGVPGRDWETCMTVNESWGYKASDNNWKSAETLIRYLVEAAGKGGNYLLNVGPTPQGTFPQPIVERLGQIGQWLRVNGEAVYGTSAGPFTRPLRWGMCTRKGSRLYLHVFDWPKSGVLNIPLANDIKQAYLLADRKHPLRFTRAEDGIRIHLPNITPDPAATVVALDVKGEPKEHWTPLRVKTGQPAVLPANCARVYGATLRLESRDGVDNLGYWTDPKDYVEWALDFEKAGAYRVSLNYALASTAAGSTLRIDCGKARLDIKPEVTRGWDDFVDREAGVIEVPNPGVHKMTLRATRVDFAAMNLRALTLKPACTR